MLRIPAALLEATLAHLRSELPGEGVGLWIGRRGRVTRVEPLSNHHPSPQTNYAADPAEVLKLLKELDDTDTELLAIYHSHPKSAATPSESDRAQAFWRVPYVIVAMQTQSVRAWRLPEVEEVALYVD
ncbi:MAG: M67 family metallopeptidase [Meiothermus sp.]|nr:M67 family metallopeptidase [Meiothermus sp.]